MKQNRHQPSPLQPVGLYLIELRSRLARDPATFLRYLGFNKPQIRLKLDIGLSGGKKFAN